MNKFAKWKPEMTAKDVPQETIVRDWFDDGVRVIIMRGPASLNTYLGVPADHPIAGFSYDDLNINCHGGLTFSSGASPLFPSGWWWYGYDYAHMGDKTAFELPDSVKALLHQNDDKVWTIGETEQDAWGAIYDMKKLMKLAEQIVKKA